ncbi:hypothetical protein [Paraperlucidibaca sp.]|uniref:hypothetical protein n=1 Tax=Paraperlucidibaca sp. TaxID=2708021 RepID=UPI0030F3CBE6
MKLASILFAASLTFLLMDSAQAIDRLAEGFPELPKDARVVAERTVACIYFSGELNGDGGDRDKEVAARLRKLKCDRVDRDLNAMRAKYRKSPKVLVALKEADQ